MQMIYKITLDNYCGECAFELYYKSNNAKKRFQELCQEGKQYGEFEQNETECSYFNPSYNEYSTFITLEECPLSSLFYDEEE